MRRRGRGRGESPHHRGARGVPCRPALSAWCCFRQCWAVCAASGREGVERAPPLSLVSACKVPAGLPRPARHGCLGRLSPVLAACFLPPPRLANAAPPPSSPTPPVLSFRGDSPPSPLPPLESHCTLLGTYHPLGEHDVLAFGRERRRLAAAGHSRPPFGQRSGRVGRRRRHHPRRHLDRRGGSHGRGRG